VCLNSTSLPTLEANYGQARKEVEYVNVIQHNSNGGEMNNDKNKKTYMNHGIDGQVEKVAELQNIKQQVVIHESDVLAPKKVTHVYDGDMLANVAATHVNDGGESAKENVDNVVGTHVEINKDHTHEIQKKCSKNKWKRISVRHGGNVVGVSQKIESKRKANDEVEDMDISSPKRSHYDTNMAGPVQQACQSQ
jgi:hypothetical protein